MIVPEFKDSCVPLERCLHDAALDATAAAMNEPDLSKTGGCGGVDVLRDHGRDVPRCKRMEVELAFNRNTNRDVGHMQLSVLSPQPQAISPSVCTPSSRSS